MPRGTFYASDGPDLEWMNEILLGDKIKSPHGDPNMAWHCTVKGGATGLEIHFPSTYPK